MGTLELKNKVKNMTDEELRAERARLDKLEESVHYETIKDEIKALRYRNLVGVELFKRKNIKND